MRDGGQVSTYYPRKDFSVAVSQPQQILDWSNSVMFTDPLNRKFRPCTDLRISSLHSFSRCGVVCIPVPVP
ncbi:uncharacterized protein ARMOST_07080 [Armillaria ostoyae]|uniref:Uncharacterized protein n=1 Tax=Armillaria ostoyae TaxID=47428 RepID=A0A284R4V9_ARMOS|nr:uncharacterized protein ARMOST_07080 [Armillaria ostoyae]